MHRVELTVRDQITLYEILRFRREKEKKTSLFNITLNEFQISRYSERGSERLSAPRRSSYFSSFPRDWIVKTWKNENLLHLRPPSGDEKFEMTAFHVREFVLMNTLREVAFFSSRNHVYENVYYCRRRQIRYEPCISILLFKSRTASLLTLSDRAWRIRYACDACP